MSDSSQERVEKPKEDCFACRAVTSGVFVLAGVLFIAEARRPGSRWKPWQCRALAYRTAFLGVGAYKWMEPTLNQVDQAQNQKITTVTSTPSEESKK